MAAILILRLPLCFFQLSMMLSIYQQHQQIVQPEKRRSIYHIGIIIMFSLRFMEL